MLINVEGDNKLLKRMLEALLKASHDGLWLVDKDATVVGVNEAAWKMNGLQDIDIIGKNMKELQKKGFWDDQPIASLQVLETKRPCTIVQWMKTGAKALVTGTPLFDSQGNLILVVVNDRDITHLTMLTAELEVSQMGRDKTGWKELSINPALTSHVVGCSGVMKRVIQEAAKLAQVGSTVLIRGDTGVGKNVIARLIHSCSSRCGEPFVAINCSAIPDPLIESEFFGYEHGAFTGSRKPGKKGLFEMAHGGTLFLDEVGDMSLSLQAKVLKFLEDKEIVPLGGQAMKKVDVRILAATNKNLQEMIDKGFFRQDLYFRLNVTSIDIPPLRDRREDIRPLAEYFLSKVNKKYQLDKKLSEEVMEVLTSLSYEGNVRELENVVERLVVISEEQTITIASLPPSLLEKRGASQTKTLKEAVIDFEASLIESTIKRCASQEKAAKLLGIDQSTLSRKIKRYRKARSRVVH